MIIFDIETGPQPIEKLRDGMPSFKAASNVKDPSKIAAQIAQKEADYISKAALSAESGVALAIGWYDTETEEAGQITSTQGERQMLEAWQKLLIGKNRPIICGFNSRRFDVPFLARRCWANGIQPIEVYICRQYAYSIHLDLMEIYQCMDRQSSISLDRLSAMLSGPRKLGSGEMFADLMQTDFQAAIEYLIRDIEMTTHCAKVLIPGAF